MAKNMAKNMAKTWQKYGKNMAKTWQKHGKNMEKTWKNMEKTWQKHGKNMAKTWKNMEKTWLLCLTPDNAISRLLYRRLTVGWPVTPKLGVGFCNSLRFVRRYIIVLL